MLVSYKWLQSYFGEKLPAPEKVAELITFGFAEVEGIEKKGSDTILDVKVLPDRACYALSHRGVAYEVAAITGFKQKVFNWPQPIVTQTKLLEVRVEAPELCSRYMARVVENVTAKEQPWVREHLEAIGQRSINPIVDGANIVMFDMGQPLHAFDADKVDGKIIVRRAKKGEKITTLDNREVLLDESVLIIADETSPLAIAGIKGGKKAEVTASTKNLILESANFSASHIRQTAERFGIKTDASKRFENRFSPELAGVGMSDFTAYLFEMDKNIRVGEIIDWYPEPLEVVKLKIFKEDINAKLGVSLSEKEIEDIFSRLKFEFETKGGGWLVTPSAFRMDICIPEDIAEEVGRLYGYEKIPTVPPAKSKEKTEIPKSFYYEWKIRETLANFGFSEVMTSSFSEEGSIAILKPLAEDKKYVRQNLRGNFEKALKINTLNAPLFGTDEIRIFEIGKVFSFSGEHTALILGLAGLKKKMAGALESAVKAISQTLGAKLVGDMKDGIFECNLDSVLAKLPTIRRSKNKVGVPTGASGKKWDISIPSARNEKFTPFSMYPFIVRDVAVFVSPDALSESVEKVIRDNAGRLVIRGPELFDEFSKDGKKSLAFRLVFQSFDRTLSDMEANGLMEKVYKEIKKHGWEIR